MRARRGVKRAWGRLAIYGGLLAAGALALQLLNYQRMVRSHVGDIYVFLIAVGFLTLGVVAGARAFGRRPPAPGEGNPQAQAALGISAREMTVLREIAAGRSNKEIAALLGVSPNTIKTHVARLFEKLGARRRTDAVNRARELGLVSQGRNSLLLAGDFPQITLSGDCRRGEGPH